MGGTTNKKLPILEFLQAENDSPLPYEGEDRPLVVVLGWMGCRREHLLKYVDQWRKRGFNTFSFCSKPIQLLVPGVIQNKGDEMLEQIKKYLKENRNCKSVIFNAFSNGGGFYYAHMVRQIHEREDCKWMAPLVKGTVLDSLPAIRPLSIYSAFRLTSPNMFVTFLLALVVPLFVILFWSKMSSYQQILTSKKNQWQHLIFYSKADTIVHSDDIDNLVGKIKNNLSDVNHLDYKCFDDSPHVLHMRAHPKIYEDKLNHFVTSIKNSNLQKLKKK
ncbi:hypothetical protein ACTFIR_007691 [Dictyostelium discoideum]